MSYAASDLWFLVGRLLYGATLCYLASLNLLNASETVQFAASQGVPYPKVTVPAGSLLLLVGGVLVMAGFYPAVGALAIVGFLLVVTPTVHDFWSHDDPAQRQDQMVHFVKNAGLLGAALVILSLAAVEWPDALGFL